MYSYAVILGAGFSHLAGLPLQSELSKLLVQDDGTPFEREVTRAIRDFLVDVFGFDQYDGNQPLPALEDYFTCIDLAANTGHSLGLEYTPRRLRALRRFSIYRVLKSLNLRFKECRVIQRFLDFLLAKGGGVGFVVLNWDIVLEKHLAGRARVKYCCCAKAWSPGNPIPRDRPTVKVAKLHGSANWLYCDNCKRLFYDLGSKLAVDLRASLSESDLCALGCQIPAPEKLGARCRRCGYPLSTHIATFSYRKSYRTHVYPAVWHAAEEILAQAPHWLFVGYSMPEPDYEVRYLLKGAQMRRKDALRIDYVVRGDTDAIERCKRFFGKGAHVTVWNDGLESFVEEFVKSTGGLANEVG